MGLAVGGQILKARYHKVRDTGQGDVHRCVGVAGQGDLDMVAAQPPFIGEHFVQTLRIGRSHCGDLDHISLDDSGIAEQQPNNGGIAVKEEPVELEPVGVPCTSLSRLVGSEMCIRDRRGAGRA